MRIWKLNVYVNQIKKKIVEDEDHLLCTVLRFAYWILNTLLVHCY